MRTKTHKSLSLEKVTVVRTNKPAVLESALSIENEDPAL